MAAIEREGSRSATPSSSPDGIPAGGRRRTGSPGQAFAAAAIGALALALLSTPAELPSWIERVGDRHFAAAGREVANLWAETVARLGLTAPHRALRQTARRLIELQWP